MGDFHASHFDDATKLKLDLFRKYTREWLGVFLHERSNPEIHIYDFFCGPGTDNAGHPGTPLVILEELDAYFVHSKTARAEDISINVHFNDVEKSHISKLKHAVSIRKTVSRCEIRYTEHTFTDAFSKAKPTLGRRDTANLLILDQFGIKEITEDVFKEIVACPTTDMLFFVSSSILRRFSRRQAIQKYLPVDVEELANIEHKKIHRYVCHNFYQKLIPEDKTYYLAPFSIEKEGKGSNIYGIIFGSNSLRGLDKFLTVCWKLDKETGEANYNIDNDIPWAGQGSLFEEYNTITKLDEFRKALLEFITEVTPTNREVFAFALQSGIDAPRARKVLLELRSQNEIRVVDINTGTQTTQFYVNYDNWKNNKPPRVRFESVR